MNVRLQWSRCCLPPRRSTTQPHRRTRSLPADSLHTLAGGEASECARSRRRYPRARASLPLPLPRPRPPRASASDADADADGDADFDLDDLDEKFDKSNFVPLDDASSGLDGATEQTFGPLAILAAGLAPQEFASLKMLMNEMGADEVKLIGYTRGSMGDRSLGQVLEAACAVETETFGSVVYDAEVHMQEWEEGVNNKPVAFLSGMYQSEIIEVVTALRYCEGLPDMAFAALVPNNYGREVAGLIDSVHSDHQAVAEMKAQMMREQQQGGGA